MTPNFLVRRDDALLAEVDLEIYTLSGLLKVTHKFTDRCFVHLKYRSERTVEVRFAAKNAEMSLETIAGEFCNELLDQRLREIVGRESEPVRNLLLAHALSGTDLTRFAKRRSQPATINKKHLPPEHDVRAQSSV